MRRTPSRLPKKPVIMRFRAFDAGHGSACGIGQSGNVYFCGAIDIRRTGREPDDYRPGSVPLA